VLNRSLDRISRTASPPFIGAQASVSDTAGIPPGSPRFKSSPSRIRLASSARPRPSTSNGDWSRTACFPRELEREIEDFANHPAPTGGGGAHPHARLSWRIWSSARWAIALSCKTPAQDLAQFEQEVKNISPRRRLQRGAAGLQRALALCLFMSTPKPVEGGPEKTLETPLTARIRPTRYPRPDPGRRKNLALRRDLDKPGKVVERRDLPEFGAAMVRFENGVRLTVKPTQISSSDEVASAGSLRQWPAGSAEVQTLPHLGRRRLHRRRTQAAHRRRYRPDHHQEGGRRAQFSGLDDDAFEPVRREPGPATWTRRCNCSPPMWPSRPFVPKRLNGCAPMA
jgi:hypothetical protein